MTFAADAKVGKDCSNIESVSSVWTDPVPEPQTTGPVREAGRKDDDCKMKLYLSMCCANIVSVMLSVQAPFLLQLAVDCFPLLCREVQYRNDGSELLRCVEVCQQM